MDESKADGLRVDFDRRLKLEFQGSKVTSHVGLPPTIFKAVGDAVLTKEGTGYR